MNVRPEADLQDRRMPTGWPPKGPAWSISTYRGTAMAAVTMSALPA